MAELPLPTPPPTFLKQMSRHIFALLALLALGVAVGLAYLFNQTTIQTLKLGAGMELKYREGLTDILCQEAERKELKIEIQWNPHAMDALQQVDKHELDAAIIPAGLSVPAEKVRQVTMLDCQILHLFVKPEIHEKGLAGLRGHSIFMGPSGTEVRYVAEQILKYIGLTGGKDFDVDSRAYDELMKSPDTMPDAIFGLSPLPSPLGEKLARQFGYQLLELPMGEALSLRKPCFEDILIPADTYGVSPAVPQKPMHSIGVRSVLVAHSSVPSLAVEHLLEVFYESDFARRANVKKLDPALLQRSSAYPAHRGTEAYIHRNDPWIVQKLLTKLQGFIGSVVSALSAILLAWHWIRRKKVDVGPYQQQCAHLDLDAQRAAYQGEFGEVELSACLTQLARLKAEVLEQHHEQFLSGDKQVADIVARIEGMQTLLPSLVRSKAPVKHLSLDFGPPQRKAA
ncbi:MAG: TAXI family TRAP transporter solute-binding subunit [Thermoguttaceae bacterium]